MRKGNKADYVVAMKSQVGDSWVDEDHLPPTGGNVLLVDATYHPLMVMCCWLMPLTTH